MENSTTSLTHYFTRSHFLHTLQIPLQSLQCCFFFFHKLFTLVSPIDSSHPFTFHLLIHPFLNKSSPACDLPTSTKNTLFVNASFPSATFYIFLPCTCILLILYKCVDPIEVSHLSHCHTLQYSFDLHDYCYFPQFVSFNYYLFPTTLNHCCNSSTTVFVKSSLG